MSLRTFEFICCTSLEKGLLIAKNELFVGFTFLFDRVADHEETRVEDKFTRWILSNS